MYLLTSLNVICTSHLIPFHRQNGDHSGRAEEQRQEKPARKERERPANAGSRLFITSLKVCCRLVSSAAPLHVHVTGVAEQLVLADSCRGSFLARVWASGDCSICIEPVAVALHPRLDHAVPSCSPAHEFASAFAHIVLCS